MNYLSSNPTLEAKLLRTYQENRASKIESLHEFNFISEIELKDEKNYVYEFVD